MIFSFSTFDNKQSVTTKSTKCSLFQTLKEPIVNRKDLRALTLVGPTRSNLVLDPLAKLHLDNPLFMNDPLS